MVKKNYIRWDIKRDYAVYKSVSTALLKKWIREGKIKDGEVFVWKSGMSGWDRPEDIDEFKGQFKKKK